MFNLTGSEVLFLLVAGLVVLGPERLPGVVRRAGRMYGDLRRTVSGVERELRESFAEPVADIRETMKSATAAFGEVDNEPSPPMRPERASAPGDDVEDREEGKER